MQLFFLIFSAADITEKTRSTAYSKRKTDIAMVSFHIWPFEYSAGDFISPSSMQ